MGLARPRPIARIWRDHSSTLLLDCYYAHTLAASPGKACRASWAGSAGRAERAALGRAGRTGRTYRWRGVYMEHFSTAIWSERVRRLGETRSRVVFALTSAAWCACLAGGETCARLHACVCVCVHTHARVHAFMHAHAHTCVCTRVCIACRFRTISYKGMKLPSLK